MSRKLWFIMVLMLPACGLPHRQAIVQASPGLPTVTRKPDYYYTCDMHPQIHSGKPGNCPICGMPLVKVMDSTGRIATGNSIRLTPAQQLIAGIRVVTVGIGRLQAGNLLSGSTTEDPRSTRVISARFSGRIDHLYARNPGQYIRKGQPLYAIYSQDLLSAEQDYLNLLQEPVLLGGTAGRIKDIREGLERRLKLWGLTPDQIQDLGTIPRITGNVTVFSDQSGILVSRLKQEGEYVQQGEGVLDLESLDHIWVRARLYGGGAGLLAHKHTSFRVIIGGMEDTLVGKQVFDDPVIREGGRVGMITLSVNNRTGKILPGMMAYIQVNQESGNRGVILPASAIMENQGKNMVWIRDPGGVFTMRQVNTGKSGSGEIQISEGLVPGEVVVVSGSYMLNSEYSLKYGDQAKMNMPM